MDLSLPGWRHTFRRLRLPERPDGPTRAAIEALVRRQIPEVGLVVSDEALGAYTSYPIITLAYAGGRLVGYHGMSLERQGARFIANLGSLYLEDGEPRGLGHALMILSALPDLLRHPGWPLTFYTLTRSPRVVASGVRWIGTFYPSPPDLAPPPAALLAPVLADLARRGEALEDPRLLTLAPPSWGFSSVPLPTGAWSRDAAVNAYMKQALGADEDRRVLVLGEVTLKELLRILRRSLSPQAAPTSGRRRWAAALVTRLGSR